jgi:hypothetical protein
VVIGTDYTGCCKSNYHAITTTTAHKPSGDKNQKYILQKEHQHLLLLGKSNLHLTRLNHYVMSHVNTIDIMKTHFIAFYIQMS